MTEPEINEQAFEAFVTLVTLTTTGAAAWITADLVKTLGAFLLAGVGSSVVYALGAAIRHEMK